MMLRVGCIDYAGAMYHQRYGLSKGIWDDNCNSIM